MAFTPSKLPTRSFVGSSALQLSERLIPHIAMQLVVGQAGVVVLEAIVTPGTLLSVTIQ